MSIDGTDYHDELYGTVGDDVINALGGNDTIYASSGNDLIDGGPGNGDTLYVDISNADSFAATPTASRTYVITSTSILDGSGELNTSFSSVERLTFSTIGAGDFGDTVDASNYVSPLLAGFPPLRIHVGDGDDVVIGSAGGDYISLGLGDNILDAGDGEDIVYVHVDNSSGDVIYVAGSGGVLHTSQDGVDTNSISNAESVTIRLADADAPLTHIDASAVSDFTGTLNFSDTNGTDITVGSSGANEFVNYDEHTTGNDVFTGNGGADIFD